MLMKRDEILKYKVKTPCYECNGTVTVALFSIFLILGCYSLIEDTRSVVEYVLLGLLMLAILGICIFGVYKLVVKAKKERQFFNSIVILSQEILRDSEQKKSHDYITLSASFIIEYRLEKYDRDWWEEKEYESISAPYRTSSGDRDVICIVNLANDENFRVAKQNYSEFTWDRLKEERKKAKTYFSSIKKNNEKRWASAEREGKRSGVKAYDIIDELDDNWDKRQKKEKEKRKIADERAELAAIQIASGRCRFCQKKIPRLARKCPYCTADL